MSEYFKNKLQKLNNEFLNSLGKLEIFKNDVVIVRNLNKDKNIEKIAKEFLEDLKDVSEHLFNEEYKESINNVKLYENILFFPKIKEEDAVMRYLRLIYIYSLGIEKPSKAKKIMKKNFNLLEKKVISNKEEFSIPSNIEELIGNLPSNITDLVKELSGDVIRDMEKNGGNINLPDMLNFANSIKGKIEKKIENGDICVDSLGKEIEEVGWLNKMVDGNDSNIDPMSFLKITSQLNDIIKK